jgi:8-oxo-dGTP diphosphatase
LTEYVCGFAGDGEYVLLVEKLKPNWMAGRMNGIGGKLEDYEDIEAGMIREWKEEVGEDTKVGDWRYFSKLETDEHLIYFFIKRMEKDDLFKYHFKNNDIGERMMVVPIKSIHRESPLNIIPNLAWLVPMAFDKGKVFANVVENLSPNP